MDLKQQQQLLRNPVCDKQKGRSRQQSPSQVLTCTADYDTTDVFYAAEGALQLSYGGFPALKLLSCEPL